MAYREVQSRRAEIQREREANRLFAILSGRHALEEQFQVSEPRVGYFNLHAHYSLSLDLKAKQARLLDSVWWYNPIVKGKTKYDGYQLLALHRETERVIARHKWLSDWKAREPGRYIQVSIVGNIPNDETDMGFFVDPPWKQAGLKGKPRYCVLLRRPDGTWLSLYFGRDESRALLESATPPKEPVAQRHPIDSLHFRFHPRAEIPTYGIVSSDGTWKTETMPPVPQKETPP